MLIVDDNPDILIYLKAIFDQSFKVETASNGNEALVKAFEIIPRIIITDIMMPEIDGLELCKTIKNDVRTSHIPVILLTARTSNLFQTEGLETGADDYITKPFDERVLSLKVKNLIASRNALRKKYTSEMSLNPKDITIAKSDEKFLNDVIDIIDDNISDSNFRIEEIALKIGMSHSVLYRKINALIGLSLIEFIRSVRLKRAAELFSKTSISVSQASFDVGFTDPKYFSKCFQKYFSLTPSQYITANRKDA
jgi:YesN/AraC family two-component response regulator